MILEGRCTGKGTIDVDDLTSTGESIASRNSLHDTGNMGSTASAGNGSEYCILAFHDCRFTQRQISGTARKSMSRCARTGDPSASHSQTTSTSQPRSRSAVIFR